MKTTKEVTETKTMLKQLLEKENGGTPPEDALVEPQEDEDSRQESEGATTGTIGATGEGGTDENEPEEKSKSD